MKILRYIGFEMGIIISLLSTSMYLTHEYERKIYDAFFPLSTETLEFVSFTMDIFIYILTAFFWCVLMCVRLYIKSLINKRNPKNQDEKKFLANDEKESLG
jgi:hypothetical protein